MGKANIPASLRSQVRLRAQGKCEYCKISEKAQVAAFHCDHCKPEVAKGETSLSNLAWACPRCNGSKGREEFANDPETSERVPLFNPRRDRWEEHFSWSEDHLKLIALSPTGRATRDRLKMNRPKIISIRELMIRLGLHP